MAIAAIVKNGLLSAVGLMGRQTWVWTVVLLSGCNLGRLLNLSELISLSVKMGLEMRYVLYCSDV